MFGPASDAGARFLEGIKKDIDLKEFDLLAREPGFVDPNTFAVGNIIRPLDTLEFPQKDHYEYLWGIYECEISHILRYSKWMRIYLASLYVYCNKQRIWGINIDSDFYFMMLEAVKDDQDVACGIRILSFLEWLYDHVKADEGYDDYFCLLSWVFLRRLVDDVHDQRFEMVLSLLVDKKYTKRMISELTVGDSTADKWYVLHRSLPLPIKLLSVNWEAIILGSP